MAAVLPSVVARGPPNVALRLSEEPRRYSFVAPRPCRLLSHEPSNVSDSLFRSLVSRSLPPELWRKIWTELPFADRISVSHVCRSWRTTALAFASLWSDIATVFVFHEEQRNASSTERHPHLVALLTLLDRSGTSPVRLKLDFEEFVLDADDVALLTSALRTHAGHIKYLHLRAASNCHTIALISSVISSMHSLDYLKLESIDFDIRLQSVLGDAVLTRLRCLELDGFIYDGSHTCEALPAVKFLDYTATEIPLTPRYLSGILSLLPGLERLHLNLEAGWWNELELSYGTPTPIPASLRSISLSVFSAAELAPGGVLTYLLHTSRAAVALRFAYVCDVAWTEPYAIFDALAAPHTLVLRSGFGARAIDARGFIREVYWSCAGWSEAAATMLFKRMAQTLRTLIIDAPLLPALREVIMRAPALRHVTLRVRHDGDLKPAPLPIGLHTLCIELVDMEGIPCLSNGKHRLDVARVLGLLSSSSESTRRVIVLRLAQVRLKKSADRAVLMRLRELVGAAEIPAFDSRSAETERLVVGLPIG